MRFRDITAPALIACGLLLGCASTDLVGFKDPDYRSTVFNRVAVYANTSDLRWRTDLETSMVKSLRAVGVTAEPTMELLPPTRSYTPEERLQILKERQIEGLVEIRLVNSGVNQEYIPVHDAASKDPSTESSTPNVNNGSSAGETGIESRVPWAYLETRLLDVTSEGQVAWYSSAASSGKVLAGFDDVRQSYVTAVVKELAKQNVVHATEPLSVLDGPQGVYGRLR